MKNFRLVAVGLTVAVASLSACSSSGGASSDGSSSVTGSSRASGSSASDQGAAALAEAVARYEAAPTSIGITSRLTSKPGPGKTFVYLSCTDNQQCPTIGSGVKQAAKAVGWNVKTLTYTSANPATLVAAMNTALQYKPVAVTFTGPPYATWKQVVPAYAAAGVKIIPAFDGETPVTSTILPQPGSNAYNGNIGKIIGDWFAADSKGSGHALVLNIPAYESLVPMVNAMKAVGSTACTSCKFTELDATVQQSDAGQINGLLVAALQKDPSIKYILVPNAPFTAGLTQALNAAGLARSVKVAGFGYTGAEISDLKAGGGGAWTGAPLTYIGWSMMDVALRASEGLPIPEQDQLMTTQLITSSNVSALKNTSYYEPPFDYQSQFKKLWLAG